MIGKGFLGELITVTKKRRVHSSTPPSRSPVAQGGWPGKAWKASSPPELQHLIPPQEMGLNQH